MKRAYNRQTYKGYYRYDSDFSPDPFNGTFIELNMRRYKALQFLDIIEEREGVYYILEPYLFTDQIGQILGVIDKRVLALITSGRLKAIKSNNTWLVKIDDLESVLERSPGAPKGRPMSQYYTLIYPDGSMQNVHQRFFSALQQMGVVAELESDLWAVSDYYLSLSQVADELDKSLWQVKNLIRKGILKSEKINTSWVILKSDLEGLVNE